MNKFTQILLFSSSLLLLSLLADARQAAGPVYAAAMSNCEIVKQITLTDEEAAAWQDVKSLEAQMEQLHEPLKAVEQQLATLGQEIDKVSDLVVQEDEEALYINKELLREQDTIAAKMSALVDAHQGDFEALGKLGEQISSKAEIFSDSINTAFADIDYEHVEIYSKDDPFTLSRCSAHKFM